LGKIRERIPRSRVLASPKQFGELLPRFRIDDPELSPGISYSYKNRSFLNFGLSLKLRYKAVELFFIG